MSLRIAVECAIVIAMLLSLVAAFIIVKQYLGIIFPVVSGVIYAWDLRLRIREQEEDKRQKGRL